MTGTRAVTSWCASASPSTDYQKRLIRIFRAFSYQQFMIPGTSLMRYVTFITSTPVCLHYSTRCGDKPAAVDV
jgi:hypothetical protein